MELEQIDHAIQELGPAADATPLAERIKALTETRCLNMLYEPLVIAPSNGLSLRTYWNTGGRAHLQSILDLGKPGDHWLWTPPTVRRTLTLETNPHDPLREWLCPYADETCGRETRGWALRAAHEFALLARQSRETQETRREAHHIKPGDEDCLKVAMRAPYRHQFDTFRDCADGMRVEHPALPIGNLRAPDHGWLIVQGRRGLGSFCDETRAYDLATGSAYRVASCTEYQVRSTGGVDYRATDARRTVEAEMGRLPLLALREAAWMLLLVDQVEQVVDGVDDFIPPSLPLWFDDDVLHGVALYTISTAKPGTALAWQIVNERGILKDGYLAWSTETLDDAAKEHAATMLRVAEANLVLGCPEALPLSPLAMRIVPAADAPARPVASSPGLWHTDSEGLQVIASQMDAGFRVLTERQRACSDIAALEPRP